MLLKVFKNFDHFFLVIAAILFIVGLTINLYEVFIGSNFAMMRVLTEGFLFLNYFFLIFLLLKKHASQKLVLWLIVTFAITIFLEILGVRTGLVFGEYEYGSTLQLQFMNVPLLIGICWVVIVFCAVQFAEKVTQNIYLQILIAGLIGLVSDIVIEPVAIVLDYWRWPSDIVPLQNYISWFLITIAFAIFYKLLQIKIDSPTARTFFILQTIFLASVNLIFYFS